MDIELFKLIPANSITGLPEGTRLNYLESALSLPVKAQDMLFSDSTGAYVQGLAKSNHIAPEHAFKIGLAILEIAIHKKEISELSTTLSKELDVSLDNAVEMASEIDQDLFAPIQGELDAFWAQQESASPTTAAPKKLDSLPSQDTGNTNRTPIVNTNPASPPGIRGATNVLDLKELNARPEQKDLPPKPVQKKLMPGNRTVDLSQRPTTPDRSTALPRVAPTPPPVPPKPQFPLPPTRRP